MTFEDWMRHQGLSESSTRKYVGAIQGPSTAWAIENELWAGPLIGMTSAAAFKRVDSEIRSSIVFGAQCNWPSHVQQRTKSVLALPHRRLQKRRRSGY